MSANSEPKLEETNLQPSSSSFALHPRRFSRTLTYVAIAAIGFGVGATAGYVRPTASPPERTPEQSLQLENQLQQIDRRDFTYRAPPVVVDANPPTSTAALIHEARGVLVHLTDANPRVADVYEILGRFHSMLGEVAEAQQAWSFCLQLNPNYGHALLGLGRIAAKQANYEQAIEMFRQGLIGSPDSADLQQGLADALISNGEILEGVRLLKAATRQQPANHELQIQLGAAYLQLHQYADAKTHYEKATELLPERSTGWFGLANACTRLADTEAAAHARQEFSRLKTKEMKARKVERSEYDDLAAMSEDIGRIYTDTARVHLATENPRSAERLFKRAAQLNSRDAACRQALAWLHAQRNDNNGAIQYLSELAKLEPHADQYSFEIARLLVQMDRHDEAKTELERICERFPDRATGFLGLADLYIEQLDEPASAIIEIRQAIQIQPTADAFVKLAAAHERVGNLTAAMEAMDEAVRLSPSDIQFDQMRALLRRKAKDRETR